MKLVPLLAVVCAVAFLFALLLSVVGLGVLAFLPERGSAGEIAPEKRSSLRRFLSYLLSMAAPWSSRVLWERRRRLMPFALFLSSAGCVVGHFGSSSAGCECASCTSRNSSEGIFLFTETGQ